MVKDITELMKPRYKVIADYPNSDFDIGDIIEMEGKSDWYTGNQDWYTKPCGGRNGTVAMKSIKAFEPYPHLFQPLQWWQERSDDQLPQYLKFIANKKNVVKLVRLYNRDMVDIDHKGTITDCLDMELFLPATESEYTQYINTK